MNEHLANYWKLIFDVSEMDRGHAYGKKVDHIDMFGLTQSFICYYVIELQTKRILSTEIWHITGVSISIVAIQWE